MMISRTTFLYFHLYNARSLNNGRHVPSLEDIFLSVSQPVFALCQTTACFVQTQQKKMFFFSLVWSDRLLKPTIHCTQTEHQRHYIRVFARKGSLIPIVKSAIYFIWRICVHKVPKLHREDMYVSFIKNVVHFSIKITFSQCPLQDATLKTSTRLKSLAPVISHEEYVFSWLNRMRLIRIKRPMFRRGWLGVCKSSCGIVGVNKKGREA